MFLTFTLPIVEYLLKEVDEKNPKDEKGRTPLQLTMVLYGRLEMFKHAWIMLKNKFTST